MGTSVLHTVFFFLSVCSTLNSIADVPDEKSILKDARSYYMSGHYDLAKKKYLELISIQPENPDYQFETGLTIFYSEIGREKSLPYFEKALGLDKKNSIPETYYYCGLASLYSENTIQAKSYFSKFIPFLDPEKGKELLTATKRLMEMCDNFDLHSKAKDEKIMAFNPGTDLNSEYSEYAPILKKDGSTLLFTARKRGSTGGKKSADAIYYEDIYIALKRDGKWLNSIKIDSLKQYSDSPINTGRHNAAVSFNSAETKLYLYKDADLFESELINGKWSEPEKMNSNLNTKEHEPSVFVSPDEKYLLFVSTRDGGFGGRDIYISNKGSDGEWGPAINLGDKINTPYDDDAPFLTADGNELYFSSKGHNSMGGFDIFVSSKSDSGKWTDPKNLGIPVNSTADDIYFIQSDDKKNILLSSNRMGTMGGMDIFEIKKIKKDSALLAVNTFVSGEDSTSGIKTNATGNPDKNSAEINNFIFHPTKVNENYQQRFAYNRTELDAENADYLGFLNQISMTINQKGFVEIIIESSASRVPTTTFVTNNSLANKRGEDAKGKIEKSLMGVGFTNDKFKITIEPKVQGPAYKNDFESNREEYEKYQYLKLSFR